MFVELTIMIYEIGWYGKMHPFRLGSRPSANTSCLVLEKLPFWLTFFIYKRGQNSICSFNFAGWLTKWDDNVLCIDTSNYHCLTFILITHNVIPTDGWPTGILRALFTLTPIWLSIPEGRALVWKPFVFPLKEVHYWIWTVY